MTHQTRTRRSKERLKGFTLIEMVIVVGILAILVGLGGPAMSGYLTRSRLNTANAAAKVIFNSAQTICQEFEFLDRNGSSSEFYGSDGGHPALAVTEGEVYILADKAGYDQTNRCWRAATLSSNTVDIAPAGATSRASAYEIIGGLAAGNADAQATANPDDSGSSFMGRMAKLYSDMTDTCFAIYIENYQVRYVMAATTLDSNYVGTYPVKATAKVGEAGGAPFTIEDSDRAQMAAQAP